jgi:hypothetical protein
MPPNPDVLRHELARRGINPDTPSGRWILQLLAHGERATGDAVNHAKPVPKRPRPPRKAERSQPPD